MIGMTVDRRAFVDARGRVYPVRVVAVKLADTIARTLLLVGTLYLIAALWEAFH